MTTTVPIAVEGLTKRYGDIVAVDDITLEVAAGEVLVVLGRNGAGKTTLVEMIEGLRAPDAGTVTVLGEAPTAPKVRAAIGVMPQRGDLYAGIRTDEALRLFASFYDAAREPEELLQLFGLERVRRSSYRRLSGGEKRRLSLALAIIGRPQIAFLDEPTSEMDVEGRTATWELVRTMRDQGTTIVLTSHELEEVERVADRVAILREGRLVALGHPSDLAPEHRSEITLEVESGVDAAALGEFLGMKVKEIGDARYRLTGIEADPTLVSRLTTWLAARGVLVRTLRAGGRSLEEIYLELTR